MFLPILLSTILIKLITILLCLFAVILASAFISISERHIVASIQRRTGPSIIGGSFGLLQPLADGLKLILKEYLAPNKSKKFWFYIGPIYTFFLALLIWANFNIDYVSSIFFNGDYLLLNLIAFLVINSYGIIISVIYSTNKFALIGGIRSIALSVSYGLSLSLIFLSPCYLAGSFNLHEILAMQQYTWFLWTLFPIALLFWITILTEIKKIPFDVGESEAELGSGFLIEYSATNFAIFVVSEYIYIILLLSLFNSLFLGGGLSSKYSSLWIYNLKLIFLILIYFIIRSVLPNFRFDQIMLLHWKYILPAALSYFLFIVFVYSII